MTATPFFQANEANALQSRSAKVSLAHTQIARYSVRNICVYRAHQILNQVLDFKSVFIQFKVDFVQILVGIAPTKVTRGVLAPRLT